MRVVALIVFLSAMLAGQQVDKVLFFGPGGSSALANGAKSLSIGGGGKLVVHLGKSGWFTQVGCSASRVIPQADRTTPYWSMKPSASLGYRFQHGKSRLAIFGGLGYSRSRTGDFLPTPVAGFIIRIKGRWGDVQDFCLNSSSFSSSNTLGYRF